MGYGAAVAAGRGRNRTTGRLQSGFIGRWSTGAMAWAGRFRWRTGSARGAPGLARAPAQRAAPMTIPATAEQLVLVAALFWALSANQSFLLLALRGRSPADAAAWGLGAALLVALVALHVLLLAPLATRWTVKPLVAVLTVVAACAGSFIKTYGVVLAPSMMRNVLRTDPAEAGELLGPGLALHLALHAGLPLLLLWRVRLRPRRLVAALGWRLALVGLALALGLGAVLSVFQQLSALTRNQRELRYLVTPANVLWSAGSAAWADTRGAARPREPIGLDAAPGPSWAARSRPLVLVLVVGETARAANWGLSGYARQTTPQLAALQAGAAPAGASAAPGLFVNFTDVTACGTDTETSLPCMFAPVGRRAYDAAAIRGRQSLLHVAERAGVAVHWRDNQSGCKGVCEGLPADTVAALAPPGLCADGRCLDEGLLADLDARLAAARGTQLWVLHMLGNHGPSYFRRYPPAFARLQPECRDDELRRCSTEQIVNAYDNALLYTDHVLATAVARLQAAAASSGAPVDVALIYVSDHGESLGERGLYLHGMPWAIAPDVQKKVPMVLWASAGFERGAGLAAGCLAPQLQRRSGAPLSHDHLFHTVLGLLDVRTALYEPALDLAAPCRDAAAAAAVAERLPAGAGAGAGRAGAAAGAGAVMAPAHGGDR